MNDTQDIFGLDVSALAAKLSQRELSSRDVVSAYLHQIDRVDSEIHAYLHVAHDAALLEADAIDSKRARGENLPALAGIPIAVKDVVVTRDMPTTCGSKILDNWMSPYDATVVTALKSHGLISLGKTNMDEFAMGSSTEHSAFGVTRNPWDPERTPGGSGGGSAACVASFQAPFAIGSDTGGSIRQPAHMTGTVGVKPSYGAVSRYGVIALASSLDQLGPVARSVADTALLHDVLAAYDPRDSTSLKHEWPSMAEAAKKTDVKGMRIGRIVELDGEGFEPDVCARYRESLELLAKNGAEIIDVSLPSFAYAVAAYYVLLPAEASSNLARFDSVRFGLRVEAEGGGTVERVMSATRSQGFGPEVKRRIILGTHVLSAGFYDSYYGNAQRVRTLVQADFAKAFEHVDVLASPTAPSVAFRFGEKMDDPLAMYMNDVATIPANLAGIPGMSLPAGLSEDGLPIGIQFLAPAFADHTLYRVGATLEALLSEKWGGLLSSLLFAKQWKSLEKEQKNA